MMRATAIGLALVHHAAAAAIGSPGQEIGLKKMDTALPAPPVAPFRFSSAYSDDMVRRP